MEHRTLAITKQKILDQIAADIVADNVCPDLAKQAKNLVPGAGNPDADIVFIGEAPGKNEDEQGKPFVGAAGKFLNEMLANVDMVREDIFITNIVKYRPPNNRDPLPDEKAAFWPYLVRQLEVIQPKIVITLGRHSMEYFLPGQKISLIHGQPKRIRMAHFGKPTGMADDTRVDATHGANELVLVILPLYHPAAALYNGGMRQTLIDDFNTVPAIIKQITN